ncbi:2OG-Fe(II) oxygenase [Alteromonas aestuariivivens]|uniref:2OG-Fe(II) oxygenase n=1 Tax=Alteromonas aestuariivivens TaxID=1938339 RepID=A0A3D8M4K1_9ALTE|nr:2OG-Fe(II) oxygenase [Alteromonas aestuariivivens]RDV24500.1 2OG-Fe(II) oxygenase [Alteromonas aestuariivivens]
MNAAQLFQLDNNTTDNSTLFARIADDLYAKGYSIQPEGLPAALCEALYQCNQELGNGDFVNAGVGRQTDHHRNQFIRNDEICWIDGTSEAGRAWLNWAEELKVFLNRNLFMGLFSFESHFAHYAPGSFYKRHYDAFRGESNRVLSLVTYLNPDWQREDGGELVLYRSDDDHEGIKLLPRLGTLVLFLSEEFPHEVLPANKDRFSVASWYRINTTHGNQIDPPR